MLGKLAPAPDPAFPYGASHAPRRALTAGEIAWLASVPCAAAVVAAIVLLGPALGHLLAPSTLPAVWRYDYFAPTPEPVEHARYLLALLGPLLLSGVVVAARRRSRSLHASAATALVVHVSQGVVLLFLFVCVAAQRRILYGAIYAGPLHRVYFTSPTLVATPVLALVAIVSLRVERIRSLLAGLLQARPRRELVGVGAAVLFTLAWELTAVQLDRSAGGTNFAVSASMPFWLDEAFGVLNGLTPLVDFNSQYSHLWPYVAAGSMKLFGASTTVFTTTLATAAGIVLLTVYGTFRRVAHSALAALALYLPFVATGFFMELGPVSNRYGPSNLLSLFPMRYAGPYVLAWLLARHLDGARPRRLAPIFAVAGLAVVNNPEFGLPALGATLAALAWTRTPWSWRTLRPLLGAALIGLAAAFALVTLFTLAYSGSLPDFGMVAFFPRLYGVIGFGMLPMPTLGFHLALYLTFVAAIAVGTVRVVTRREGDVLTGLLVWSGVFGLGASSYFAGRSHPEVLIDLFSAWAFALMLLLLVVVRAIAARPSHLPRLAEVAVLLGTGLAVCSLAQTPTPWSQIHRLARDEPPPFYNRLEAERFVARLTRPGEAVAVLVPPGHRITYDIGVRNVSRYVGWEAMPLEQQMVETLDALHRTGGNKLFLPIAPDPKSELGRLLARRGYRSAATGHELIEWVGPPPRAGS
ncbi:MAG TPA: hypothetical protein VE972_09370 [Conexibacter sp.]|nr:hypothetical protein [Conexibacter sp.]